MTEAKINFALDYISGSLDVLKGRVEFTKKREFIFNK